MVLSPLNVFLDVEQKNETCVYNAFVSIRILLFSYLISWNSITTDKYLVANIHVASCFVDTSLIKHILLVISRCAHTSFQYVQEDILRTYSCKDNIIYAITDVNIFNKTYYP